jgi:hypothetical protein
MPNCEEEPVNCFCQCLAPSVVRNRETCWGPFKLSFRKAQPFDGVTKSKVAAYVPGITGGLGTALATGVRFGEGNDGWR